jgi:hypothetical protein
MSQKLKLFDLMDELLYNIIEYTTNDNIMQLVQVNKKMYNLIHTDHFHEYLMYRPHPLVFNKIDNICNKCNWSLILLNDVKSFTECYHDNI